MTRIRQLLVHALVLSGLACGLVPSVLRGEETVAYRGATLETMGPAGRLENATIVIRGDRILAVGQDVEIPSDARVVDAAGKTIMPGIVEPYFVFGPRRPTETTSQATARGRGRGQTGRGGSTESGPFTRISQYFYPYETDFRPLIRSGITTANLVSSGQGQSALVRPVRDDRDANKMIIDANGCVFAEITNSSSALNAIRSGLDPDRPQSSSRGRGFGGGRGGFRGRGGPGRGGQEQADEERDEDESQREESVDEVRKIWQSVREGKTPLVLNANSSAGIAYAVKILREYEDVRVTLVASGENLHLALDVLSDRDVTVVLGPAIDAIPYTSQRINVSKMVHDRGITLVHSLALSSSALNANQDDPLLGLAWLVHTGLPRETALQSVTITPARMLGLDETLGSLEENKLANLLVFDGDPLETGGRLHQVILEGRIVHEDAQR